MPKKSTGTIVGVSGILLLCLACLGLAAFVYGVGVLPLELNPGYSQGMQILQNDPAVKETLGSPVHPSYIVMGKVTESLYGDGHGNLWSPIFGSRKRGEVDIYVTKAEGGPWHVLAMTIHVDGKRVLTWDANRGFHPIP